jgi:hypothetical protein
LTKRASFVLETGIVRLEHTRNVFTNAAPVLIVRRISSPWAQACSDVLQIPNACAFFNAPLARNLENQGAVLISHDDQSRIKVPLLFKEPSETIVPIAWRRRTARRLAKFQKPFAAKSGIVRLQHIGKLFTDGLPVVIVGRLHDRRDGFVMLPGLRAPVYWFAENPACECMPICWLCLPTVALP